MFRMKGYLDRLDKTLVLAGILLVLAVICFTIYFFNSSSNFPSSVKKGIKFSLYYPVKPPAGLIVDRTSFSSPASQVISFTVDDGGSPKYYVSLEPVPSNFDPSTFQKNFIKNDLLQVPIGSGEIGTLNNQLIGEVRTNDNTLILINTGDISASSQLKALFAAFQKSR